MRKLRDRFIRWALLLPILAAFLWGMFSPLPTPWLPWWLFRWLMCFWFGQLMAVWWFLAQGVPTADSLAALSPVRFWHFLAEVSDW